MKEQEFKEYFFSLIEDCSVRIVNPKLIIIRNKNHYPLVEYTNNSNKEVWLCHHLVFSKLKSRFNYCDGQIKELIKDILGKQLNIVMVDRHSKYLK